MRSTALALIKMWSRKSGSGAVIAVLDFLLAALACYTGYAVRLSLFIPPHFIADCAAASVIFPAITVITFALFGQYKVLWAQACLDDHLSFAKLYAGASAVFVISNVLLRFAALPRTSLAIMLPVGFILCSALRVSCRLAGEAQQGKSERLKTLIVGAGEAGSIIARDLLRGGSELEPCAFADDDPLKIGRRVAGLDVIASTEALADTVRSGGFKVVLIAIPSAHGGRIKEMYTSLSGLDVSVRILPNIRELAGGEVSVTRLRNVRLEDLLGRDPVRIELDDASNYIRGKRVLITGAGGSIGSEIVRQTLGNDPQELFVLGHGEQSIYTLTESLSGCDVKITPIIADVADETAMRGVFSDFRPQIVFHAAAHKHVPLMELSPREAMRVNTLGTRTLARTAGEFGAERMVMISTDKAVNPSSVMGASKRAAEIMIERTQREYPDTAYMAVRFGNVLGSRGSVVPKFEAQIASGGPVTVTHPKMKRYFMLIPEAVSLVIQAGALGTGGELFVLDMGEPVVITEMAELLIRLFGYEPYRDIPIVYTGIRPGEKIEEELFYDPASVRPTGRQKIFSSSLSHSSGEDADALLEEALSNPDKALEMLRRIVPEFVSPEY